MKQVVEIVTSIELPESITGLRKDGIVHVYIKPFVEITCEYQARHLIVLNEITEGKKLPMIYEAGESATVGIEARENAIRLENSTPVLCTAIYVQNLAHKLISEFYYRFNKPERPYKVFSDFDAGIRWLLETQRARDTKP